MTVVVTALSMCGCSFVLVDPPKDDLPTRTTIDCTTSPLAPVIDSLLTLTNFATAGYVATQDNVANKGAAVGVGIAAGALWLSSAIYGYYNVSRCAELIREAPVPFQHGWRPPSN